MLPTGTIERLIEYFFNDPSRQTDIKQAFQEFFDQDINTSGKLVIHHDREEDLFQEWFMFDFHFADGKSPLEKFVIANPLHLLDDDLVVYRDLLEHEYGSWEAMDVHAGTGMMIRNVQNGHEYAVREKSATRQLSNGNLFFGRVAKVGDHFEMVGATPWGFDIKLDPVTKVKLSNMTGDMNLKTVNRIFGREEAHEQEDQDDHETDDLTPQTVNKNCEIFLCETGLNAYVSVSVITKWMRETEASRPLIWFSLLRGLLDDDMRSNKQLFKDLFTCFRDLYVITPQKELDNLSPLEAKNVRKNQPNNVQWHTGGHDRWVDDHDRAMSYMKARDSMLGCQAWEDCFGHLYDEGTTRSDIWRFFANAAVCYFNNGDEKIGVGLVECALSLNPNYDFACDLRREYEDGMFNQGIIFGRLKKMSSGRGLRSSSFKKTNAYRYFHWLQHLKINFATTELTKSPIHFYDADGDQIRPGRNDACPCGKTKADGNPIKFKKCCGFHL